MAVPQGLTLKHHRDLADREARPIVRQVLVALVAVVLLLGLFNLFGQAVNVSSAESSAARFEVSAPTKLRGGIFFQARFIIEAIEELENATIVLDPDWLEDITLNTVAPAPGRERRAGTAVSRSSSAASPLATSTASTSTSRSTRPRVGQRSQDVELYDGDELLLSVDRDAIVWP